MTLQECTALLTPLALACKTEMDAPTYRAYHKVLKDVPARLAEAGIEQLTQTGLPYGMPTAPAIRAAAEQARKAFIAAHPWEACIDCEETPGWCAVIIDGVTRMQRCRCKDRYQAQLAEQGVTSSTLALPARERS